jgi:hypothetical protein
MAYGVIGFSQAGKNGLNQSQPSPSIWGDCSSQELLDEGAGYFTYKTFFDAVTLPDLPTSATGASTIAYETATFSGSIVPDHAIKITTAAAAQDAITVLTKPIGPIAAGSGRKYWAETAVSVASATNATQGLFFGLAIAKVGITSSTGGASTVGFFDTVSATRTSNKVQTGTFVGFLGMPTGSGNLMKIDVAYMNQPTYSVTPTTVPATTSTATTVGSVIYVQTDVLNSPALAANGGSTINTVPAGVLTVLGPNTGGDVVANVFIKLGLRYDGQGFLYFYVNGILAAKLQVTSLFDQVSSLGTLLSITGNAVSIDCDFIRAGSKQF